MAHTPLPKLEVKRPLVALLGYPAVLLFPLAISWGLFELIGFVRGERLPGLGSRLVLSAAAVVRQLQVEGLACGVEFSDGFF